MLMATLCNCIGTILGQFFMVRHDFPVSQKLDFMTFLRPGAGA